MSSPISEARRIPRDPASTASSILSRPAPAALRPALWMLAGALAFAGMGGFTYALGPRCDWLLIALVRVLFMCAMAVAMARWRGIPLVLWKPRTLWVRSCAGCFSLVCNFYAMTRLPVGDVLTLTNTYPLWIILLSAILLRLPPTLAEWLGVASGLAGVVLIQQPHLGGDRIAASVALASSVSTAVAMLGLHRLKTVKAPAIVAHFAAVASVVATVWMCARGWPVGPRAGELTTWLLLLGVGVSGTIGQLCLTKAYASGPPGEVAVVGLSQVVFGIGLDMLFWGRQLTTPGVLGFVLVLAPTAWLTGRAGRRLAAADVEPLSPAPADEPIPLAEPDAAVTLLLENRRPASEPTGDS